MTGKEIKKTVYAGKGEFGDVFVFVNFDGKRLSITGVEGPKFNGDASGSCGQCIDAISGKLKGGLSASDRKKLREIWDRWHLNDMRAGCEHQRDIDTSEKVEVVSYRLTTEANKLRKEANERARLAGISGEVITLTDTERALITIDWWKDVHAPPDADSPLSGCYEVSKREAKYIGHVYPHEHPRGILTKPCEVCGYKYGTAWLFEEVPADVIEFLDSLPATDKCPWPNR